MSEVPLLRGTAHPNPCSPESIPTFLSRPLASHATRTSRWSPAQCSALDTSYEAKQGECSIAREIRETYPRGVRASRRGQLQTTLGRPYALHARRRASRRGTANYVRAGARRSRPSSGGLIDALCTSMPQPRSTSSCEYEPISVARRSTGGAPARARSPALHARCCLARWIDRAQTR